MTRLLFALSLLIAATAHAATMQLTVTQASHPTVAAAYSEQTDGPVLGGQAFISFESQLHFDHVTWAESSPYGWHYAALQANGELALASFSLFGEVEPNGVQAMVYFTVKPSVTETGAIKFDDSYENGCFFVRADQTVIEPKLVNAESVGIK